MITPVPKVRSTAPFNWVEKTLFADRQFQLPGKQPLQDGEVQKVAVDVTEHPIQSQIVADTISRLIDDGNEVPRP